MVWEKFRVTVEIGGGGRGLWNERKIKGWMNIWRDTWPVESEVLWKYVLVSGWVECLVNGWVMRWDMDRVTLWLMKFRCWQQRVFLTFAVRFGNEDSDCLSAAAVGCHASFFRAVNFAVIALVWPLPTYTQNVINMNGSSLYVFRGVQYCDLCGKLLSQIVKLFFTVDICKSKTRFGKQKCKCLSIKKVNQSHYRPEQAQRAPGS